MLFILGILSIISSSVLSICGIISVAFFTVSARDSLTIVLIGLTKYCVLNSSENIVLLATLGEINLLAFLLSSPTPCDSDLPLILSNTFAATSLMVLFLTWSITPSNPLAIMLEIISVLMFFLVVFLVV